MFNKITEIFMNRMYTAVVDIMSGFDFNQKNLSEKIFALTNLLFLILNIWNLFCYRSVFTHDLAAFKSPIATSAPYDSWLISIFPRLFMVIYSLINLLFSIFAHINWKSFMKLFLCTVVISIVQIIVTKWIFAVSSFYLLTFLMTLMVNIMGIISLFSYIYFI